MVKQKQTIEKPFSTKVQCVTFPIDYASYEESQKGIMRVVYRLQRKLRSQKTHIDLKPSIKGKIVRLEKIEKDLQKALEGITL